MLENILGILGIGSKEKENNGETEAASLLPLILLGILILGGLKLLSAKSEE